MPLPLVLPKGVGDLVVVRQKLSHYELGEIAHVENVMASETRERVHTRKTQTETFFEEEAEVETENERDVETAERFELERETSKVISESENFEAGASLSATYGFVSLAANTSYSNTSSTEESRQVASKFAKSTVTKAVERIKEKSKFRSYTRNIVDVEERNSHTFDNTEGPHLSGVYRWVDKVYLNKVVNYGKRLMYEFLVPEPSRYYRYIRSERVVASNETVRPEAPEALTTDAGPARLVPLSPELVRRDNYLGLVAKYSATNVSPPPLLYKKIAYKPFARQAGAAVDSGHPEGQSLAENLSIPEGYVAYRATISGHVAVNSNSLPDSRQSIEQSGNVPRIAICIGDRVVIRDESQSPEFSKVYPLNAERDYVPLSVVWNGDVQIAINIDITCVLYGNTFEEWQLDTYSAIMTAYANQLTHYEDSVAAATVRSGVAIQGENPRINVETIRAELKRQSIGVWLGYPWVTTPAVPRDGATGEPSVDNEKNRNNAISINFFESVFDWENMTYTFLAPSYAGSHSLFEAYNDSRGPDSHFHKFLTAGYARVLVPVASDGADEFNAARVLWFQATGRIWTLDTPPVFSDSSVTGRNFNALLADLRDNSDTVDIAEDFDIEDDDPEAFAVRLPTNLIKLQESSGLNGDV